MSSDNWTGGDGNWATASNWTAGVPTSSSAVTVATGDPQVTAAIDITSLLDEASVNFVSAGSSAISGNLTNTGYLNLDAESGAHGSSLTIGGTLLNTGVVQLGASNNSLAGADTVKVKAISNAYGAINVDGGTAAAGKMLLDVTGGTAGFGVAGSVTGDISLSGYSIIEFASGEFSTIASSSTLSIDGASAFVADASGLTSNSALTGLTLVAGTLELSGGAKVTTGALNNINAVYIDTATGSPGTSLTIKGAYANNGDTEVDTSSAGGSELLVSGVLTNNGDLDIGSGSLGTSSTVSAQGLVNNGSITLDAEVPTAAVALLKINAAAGFGSAGQVWGDVSLSGSTEIQFASGEITTIASGAELELAGPTARIADAATPGSNSALTGLAHIIGTLTMNSGVKLAIGGPLTINSLGILAVDTSYELGGSGGSTLTVAGTLANAGTFYLGNDDLTGSSSVAVDAINNSGGEIYVDGSFVAPERALLNVKSGVAGFGVAGEVVGSVSVMGDAAIEFASGQISTVASGASLSLWGPQATVSDASSTTTNSALTGLTTLDGDLSLDDDVTISVSGSLINSAALEIDTQNSGGSKLTVTGTLTNRDELEIGSSGMTSASTVQAAAIGGFGSITLVGGTANTDIALLDIAGAAGFGATGVLSNFVTMSGPSRIEFKSGQITTITESGGVQLFGSQAVIADASALTTNSALQGLATNHGSVELNDGASISTTGAFANSGYLDLDTEVYPVASTGGSSFTVGGTLINTGSVSVGKLGNVASDTVTVKGFENANAGTVELDGASSTAQAVLDITSGAAGFGVTGVLTAEVSLSGYASVRFATGQITRIAANASLDLESADAFIEDGVTNTNSALTGLDDVLGTLTLEEGARITTTTPLAIGADGTVNVEGGSNLTVGGALTNSGTLTIGGYDLSQAAEVVATSLANNQEIMIEGGTLSSATALLNIGGAAGFGTAGDLSGTVGLSGFGAVRFASGQISTILSSGSLSLTGPDAFIEDGASNSNSALDGLATIAGTLTIADGVRITTSGGLTVSGSLNVDSNGLNQGGSDVTIGGTLTLDTYYFTLGNSDMTAADTITASGLSSSEYLTLAGGATAAGEALLDIKAAAGFGTAGVLTGTVDLSGNSAIEFASGHITTIGSYASLYLEGPDAFIEDGVTHSDSALTELTTNGGDLSVEDGASLSTTGALTNNDLLYVDGGGYAGGGSSLTVGGLLTNDNGITVGNTGLASNAVLTASSLANDSYIDLDGNSGIDGELLVSGAVTNNGEFDIAGDAEDLAGAVSGTGQFNLSSGSALELGSSVSSGQTISFDSSSAADTLTLADATAFKGTLSGFGAGDAIDLTTFGATTTHSFSADVLTLKYGSNTATLDFSGSYLSTDFAFTSSASGTVIKFV
jgi:hypothetical protein